MKKPLTTIEKRRKVKEIKDLLKSVEKIANELLFEEKTTHSKNGNYLYALRNEMWSCISSLEYIKYYKDKEV